MLQRFSNGLGLYLSPAGFLPQAIPNATALALDAAGESMTLIGKIHLEGGAGSKTISSAGGKIFFATGSTITFADAGSTLRVGLQDIGVTGIEDGVFDVHANLVGGTDVIDIDAIRSVAMTTGTKTVSHGDLIGISVELITRGGADIITIRGRSPSTGQFSNIPYHTMDSGAGPVKTIFGLPMMAIEFDDGTMGWFGPIVPCIRAQLFTFIYNTASTPNEYALVFTLPINTKTSSITVDLGILASTSDFEIIIYSDPTGTPVIEKVITVDADFIQGANASIRLAYFIVDPSFEFQANTQYAIAFRPTTANDIYLFYMDFSTGNSKLRRLTPLGENWALGSRAYPTGPFVLDTTKLPNIGMYLSDIHSNIEVSTVF